MFFWALPNALVQLQAHVTMRAQRAIQKCLSAATFVRQRGSDALRGLREQNLFVARNNGMFVRSLVDVPYLDIALRELVP